MRYIMKCMYFIILSIMLISCNKSNVVGGDADNFYDCVEKYNTPCYLKKQN